MYPRALIPFVLALGLAGCSFNGLGPHKIDVQQGNAIDEDSLAKLQPGLSRTQVRFLMGTPLIVDPFRNDRWDYVYELRKQGSLTEQKRITLIFEGDTLARIEGDKTAGEPAAPVTEPAAAPAADPVATSVVAPLEPQAATEPVLDAPVAPYPAQSEPVPDYPLPTETPPEPAHGQDADVMIVDDNVDQLRPDPMPRFEEPAADTASGDEAVMASVNAWVEAWGRRDPEAYLAAYADSFLPQGGGSRADWEKRRRLLLGLAQNIEVRIAAPKVEYDAEGGALVTFDQHYRSDSYRDAVTKELRLIQENGGWKIVQERVLKVLRPGGGR